jgi:hypothetical protein
MPPLNSLIQRAPVITGNVCTTPECINASDFVKQHVNLTVDPCSDFYQYTCTFDLFKNIQLLTYKCLQVEVGSALQKFQH